MLPVTDLDLVDQLFPRRRRALGATSVLAQVALVAGGAGIGLLPTYLGDRHPDLVPVLPDDAVATLSYWMTARPANLRRPEVAAVAQAVADRAALLPG
jgi:DNA-binding transcriptional LysR family regulator